MTTCREAQRRDMDSWAETPSKRQAQTSSTSTKTSCFKTNAPLWSTSACSWRGRTTLEPGPLEQTPPRAGALPFRDSPCAFILFPTASIIITCPHIISMDEQFRNLTGLKPTKFLEQVFSMVLIVGSALAMWKTLTVGLNTECPAVVVLTGSMEPGYYRGDILVVTHWDEPLIPGDVVVYNLRGHAIPIVHRVITTQERSDKNLYILTKGDNNQVDDRGLYPRGVRWLHREQIMGKMRAYLPYVGYMTIMLNDYPMFKYFVLGLMAFFTIVAKDPQ